MSDEEQPMTEAPRRGAVTTIITAYNKAPYLAEAIESALRQDFAPHQVVVIDDGSTDETPEVARLYLDRIHYVRQKNRGQSHAKNRGVLEAGTEFVAFLDGDDRWRDGKLSRQVPLLRADAGVGLVCSDRLLLREGEKEAVAVAGESRLRGGWVLDDVLVDNFVVSSSVVARRDALIAVGLFDEQRRVAEDYDLWLRLARDWKFGHVDEPLVDYRVGIDSIGSRTRDYFPHVMDIQQAFLDKFYDGKFPRPRVVAQASARKYSARGDRLLTAGRHAQAATAFVKAWTLDPSDWRRAFAVARSLIPNRAAAALKRWTPSRNPRPTKTDAAQVA
ncbi:MAG: glycosyltransferase [Planctomycetales bacterium]